LQHRKNEHLVDQVNVGFDASAKPPTFELDICESKLVAPQFENGKKLPVMASSSSKQRSVSTQCGSALRQERRDHYGRTLW